MNVYWLWPAAAVSSFILTWMIMHFARNRQLLDFVRDKSLLKTAKGK